MSQLILRRLVLLLAVGLIAGLLGAGGASAETAPVDDAVPAADPAADDDAQAAQDDEEDDPAVADPRVPLERWQPIGTQVRPQRPDRWTLLDANGVQLPRGSLIDPFHLNPIKGDFPIKGTKTFFRVDALYNPVIKTTSLDNVDPQFNNQIVVAAEFFHGSTAAFRPKDWTIKVSGRAQINRGNLDIDDTAIQEALFEVKIADLSPNYDFISFRGGAQFFKTDFRGFILQDFQLGAQFFGELNMNRNQFHLAYVDFQVKNIAGIEFDSTGQDLIFFDWFWEDLFIGGFNTVFNFHYNRDRQVDGKQLDVYYIGAAANEHLGRIIFLPAIYFAFGDEEDLLGGTTTDISAFFGGFEFAYPKNWWTPRAAFFIASGDDDPTDDKAEGFDAVKDNIALFGGNVSQVIGGINFGTRQNSFLPSFRGVGTRSNFENPGIMVLNGGIDFVLSPKLFVDLNVNYFQFLEGEGFLVPAGPASGQTLTSNDLGTEFNAAVTWRVFLNENLVVKAAVNAFAPGEAGETFLPNDDTVFTTQLNLVALF